MRKLINGAFLTQRVTGQQRYAQEVMKKLVDGYGHEVLSPGRFFSSSSYLTWFWVLFILPVLARRGRLLSLTSRTPIWCRRHVVVLHDLFVISNPAWFSWTYRVTHYLALRLSLIFATQLAAVSEPVAAQIRKYASREVAVAPNAPAEVFIRVEEVGRECLEKYGLMPDRYLLTVGSLEPRKNLARLAAAYERLDSKDHDSVAFVVVGTSAKVFADESITWPSKTKFIGYATDTDLAILYRYARSLIFVSEAEGFGLPIVEAVSAGVKSLVISDIPVFRWLCGAGATYVDPLSIDDIAEGISVALRNPPPISEDVGRFTWDQTALVLDTLIRRV